MRNKCKFMYIVEKPEYCKMTFDKWDNAMFMSNVYAYL